MKHLLALIGFVLAVGVSEQAQAQTAVPGGVLTQEERAVIKDYFGRKLGEVMGQRKGEDKKADDKTDDKADEKSTAKADDDDDARKGKGKGHKGKGHKGKGKDKAKGKGRGKGLPPGLAKRSSLPPGLQRQLDEKGALPKGLRTEDLPEDLEKRLPPIKDDFKRVVVEDDVLLIERGTNRVLDILEGVLSGTGKK